MDNSDNRPIMVTIRCIAYNQKPYIRQCLDGFVMQKTNFRFEAIVHDDASTDGTASIIKEYAEKFPDIIRPILETENQWSKHDGSLSRIMNSHIRGKYVALCEGDDYWTDPNKLQLQVDEMEKHPDFNGCAHATMCIKSGRIHGYKRPMKTDGIIPVEKMREGGGGVVATNSLLFRKEVFDDKLPFQQVLNGDYSLQIRGALFGGLLYIDKCMSVYRINALGSWSADLKADSSKALSFHVVVIKMLDSLDEYTNGKYKKSIEWKKKRIRFDDARVKDDWALIKSKEYKDIYDSLNLREMVQIYLQHYAPWISDSVSMFVDIIRNGVDKFRNWK